MVTDHQVTKKASPFKCVHAGREKFKIEIGGWECAEFGYIGISAEEAGKKRPLKFVDWEV